MVFHQNCDQRKDIFGSCSTQYDLVTTSAGNRPRGLGNLSHHIFTFDDQAESYL